MIVLCCTDAFLTLVLLDRGAQEMNILMDLLIRTGIRLFTIIKMSVTGVALIVLVMHLNFKVYRFVAGRYIMHALVPV